MVNLFRWQQRRRRGLSVLFTKHLPLLGNPCGCGRSVVAVPALSCGVTRVVTDVEMPPRYQVCYTLWYVPCGLRVLYHLVGNLNVCHRCPAMPGSKCLAALNDLHVHQRYLEYRHTRVSFHFYRS